MTDLLPHLPSQQVADVDIARAFDGKNFGSANIKHELAIGVLKKALRYHCGDTITQIMMGLGLTTKTGRVTEKGRRFCHQTLNAASTDAARFAYLYSGSKTTSDAMLTIELRIINGDMPSLNDVRAAVDECINNPLEVSND